MLGRSKPRTTTVGSSEPEPLDDLVTHGRSCRRGEREHRRMPERVDGSTEAQVVRPEVVTPVADAVRLVDDEEPDARAAELLQGLLAASCSGARKRNSSSPASSSRRRTSRRSAAVSVELSAAAAPRSSNPSIERT
jgi:hypothetical protein